MHQKYKEEFISVTELWQDEINELVNSISILKTSNNPLDQRLRWKYEIVIDYLKGRIEEETRGNHEHRLPEKRTLH
tara:strand:- start:1430 stop:1657 length:228 start_codon:yes stop_codon:yes gene_type:complete